MISLSRKADYALVALAELARRAPALASARRLADAVQVPLPVLTNVLNQLAHRGLVVSARGVQGGYRIGRPANAITLAEVIEAIDGPSRLAHCCGGEGATHHEELCGLENSCRIKAPVQKVHRSLREFLSGISLSQIAFDAPVAINVEQSAGSEKDRRSGELGESDCSQNALLKRGGMA